MMRVRWQDGEGRARTAALTDLTLEGQAGAGAVKPLPTLGWWAQPTAPPAAERP
jgi:hypothetical protein